jgi:hypothetical protein
MFRPAEHEHRLGRLFTLYNDLRTCGPRLLFSGLPLHRDLSDLLEFWGGAGQCR